MTPEITIQGLTGILVAIIAYWCKNIDTTTKALLESRGKDERDIAILAERISTMEKVCVLKHTSK